MASSSFSLSSPSVLPADLATCSIASLRAYAKGFKLDARGSAVVLRLRITNHIEGALLPVLDPPPLPPSARHPMGSDSMLPLEVEDMGMEEAPTSDPSLGLLERIASMERQLVSQAEAHRNGVLIYF